VKVIIDTIIFVESNKRLQRYLLKDIYFVYFTVIKGETKNCSSVEKKVIRKRLIYKMFVYIKKKLSETRKKNLWEYHFSFFSMDCFFRKVPYFSQFGYLLIVYSLKFHSHITFGRMCILHRQKEVQRTSIDGRISYRTLDRHQ